MRNYIYEEFKFSADTDKKKGGKEKNCRNPAGLAWVIYIYIYIYIRGGDGTSATRARHDQ